MNGGQPDDVERLEQIDLLCDQFETALLANRTPRIEDFLARVPDLARPALLSELLGVEAAYRGHRADGAWRDECLQRFPELAEAVREVLAEPHTAEVPIAGNDLGLDEESTAGLLSDRYLEPEDCLLEFRIYDCGRLVFRDLFRGTVELGRQQLDENEPYYKYRRDQTWRVVMAERREAAMSRRSALIQYAPHRSIRVTNLSRSTIIGFEDDDGLEPGDTRTLPLPVLLLIGGRPVRIQ